MVHLGVVVEILVAHGYWQILVAPHEAIDLMVRGFVNIIFVGAVIGVSVG